MSARPADSASNPSPTTGTDVDPVRGNSAVGATTGAMVVVGTACTTATTVVVVVVVVGATPLNVHDTTINVAPSGFAWVTSADAFFSVAPAAVLTSHVASFCVS